MCACMAVLNVLLACQMVARHLKEYKFAWHAGITYSGLKVPLGSK